MKEIKMEKELLEIREAFQWTWGNMDTEHTADHFNIPANGIHAIDLLLESLGESGDKICFTKKELAAYSEWLRANGERHRGNLQKNGMELYYQYLEEKEWRDKNWDKPVPH